jgi:hypothetical protein
VADATLQILGLGTSAVPLDYNVSGPQTLDLIAVKGDFDGSTAGVDFVPVVEIISPAGAVMATSTGPTITAGSSATVTFAPFLRSAATQTGGGGIQFDTQPQAGQFLYVEADGPGTTSDGRAIQFNDQTGNGIALSSPVFIGDGQPGAPQYAQSGFGIHLSMLSSGQHVLVQGVGNIIDATNAAGLDLLSFFGATAVVQQATPVTLADVIALLQAYGLSA